MSALQRVALADCAAQPWRNGGGITHELLCWPPGQAAWQLRVSVATIARDGAFSRFDGVQRWFTVLSGAGVELRWPDRTLTLVPGDPPLDFDGATAPGCTLLDGATQDLNLMALQGAGRARMWPTDQPLTGEHRWRALYTTAPAVLHSDEAPQALPAHTLVWRDEANAPDTSTWTLHPGHGPAWWLTLER
jgi:uncharacterized protein